MYRMKPLGAGAFDSAQSMPIGCASIPVRAVINGSWMKSSFGTDNLSRSGRQSVDEDIDKHLQTAPISF
jgi:hypothetical protein